MISKFGDKASLEDSLDSPRNSGIDYIKELEKLERVDKFIKKEHKNKQRIDNFMSPAKKKKEAIDDF